MSSTSSTILRRSMQAASKASKNFSTSTKATVPPRKKVNAEERAALRQARKLKAAQTLEASKSGAEASTASASSTSSAAPIATKKPMNSRLVFGLGVGVPVGLLAWGIADEESPPAQFSKMIGLTAAIEGFSDQFAKPIRDKLLPDWPVSTYCLLRLLVYCFCILTTFFSITRCQMFHKICLVRILLY